jgi:hypothetical protein
MNPWWRGKPVPRMPPIRRWAFEPVLHRLRQGPAPFVLLRGPRRVGKTVLQLQVIDKLLRGGMSPNRILRLQLDGLPELRAVAMPILESPIGSRTTFWGTPSPRRRTPGNRRCCFWMRRKTCRTGAPQVNNLADISQVRGLVTGSSALRIEAGQDSLAGRVQTIEIGPLLLRKIAAFRGVGTIDSYLPHNGLGPLKEKSFWQGLRRLWGAACRDAPTGLSRVQRARGLSDCPCRSRNVLGGVGGLSQRDGHPPGHPT